MKTVYVSDVAKRWGVNCDAVRLYCRRHGVEFLRRIEPKPDGHGVVRRALISEEDFSRLCNQRGQ